MLAGRHFKLEIETPKKVKFWYLYEFAEVAKSAKGDILAHRLTAKPFYRH